MMSQSSMALLMPQDIAREVVRAVTQPRNVWIDTIEIQPTAPQKKKECRSERDLLRPVRPRDRRRSPPGLAAHARGGALPQPALRPWALSRFQDVLDASVDVETYSSAKGTVLEMMPLPLQPMIFMDPPEHDRLRALVSRAFIPRRIADLEPAIRQIVRGYLDPQVGGKGFDFVADFGAKVPMMVIASTLGVPEEDREHIRADRPVAAPRARRDRSDRAHRSDQRPDRGPLHGLPERAAQASRRR